METFLPETRPLESERLTLVPVTTALTNAHLAGREALAELLGAEVPASWPPPLYDDDAVRHFLRQLEEGPGSEWCSYYVLLRPDGQGRSVVVGICGFKGAPDDKGEVEIGYSVVPEFQRRGIASEACEALLDLAFAGPEVRRVIGHTLEHLTPSIGVMEKLGFVFDGLGPREEAPDRTEQVVRYALARESWRADGTHDGR